MSSHANVPAHKALITDELKFACKNREVSRNLLTLVHEWASRHLDTHQRAADNGNPSAGLTQQ